MTPETDGRPVVAAFDFDGTVTERDTLFPFLRFASGNTRFLLGLASQLPVLSGYLLGRVANGVAKERVLSRFLAGMSEEALEATGARFAETVLPGFVRPVALERIAWHRASGHRCILVSASLELYLKPWAEGAGFDDVIGSRMEVRDGRVTGRLAGGNCHGPEKLRRLLERVGARETFRLIAYGDSRGDRELLASADRAYYRTMPPPGEEAMRETGG
ncbi:MAG: HAD-IB family hydrolase [Gammaproteobacteria bacterium]